MVGSSNSVPYADSCAIGFRVAFVRPTRWADLSVPFFPARKVKPWAAIPLYRRCVVGRKLYCGNLSFNVASSDLEQLFSQFGTVESAEVISDRDTGRSKGFGFVEMSSDAEAQAAIQGLNQTDHDGRSLTVNEARPREDRGSGRRGGYGGGGRGNRGGRY